MKAAVRKAATPRRHTTPQRRLVTQYPRRRVLSLAAGAAAVPSVSRISWAQAYPTRPIKIVVPYAPGGSSDVIARNVAERMRASLGQPILIENVTGAGGTIGTARVAGAAPDGYTLGLGHLATHVMNGATYALPYDVVDDFEPVALLATTPFLFLAKKTVPADDLQALIAWLKANPGKASLGIGGVGSPDQIAAVLFSERNWDALHIRALSRRRGASHPRFGRGAHRPVDHGPGHVSGAGTQQEHQGLCGHRKDPLGLSARHTHYRRGWFAGVLCDILEGALGAQTDAKQHHRKTQQRSRGSFGRPNCAHAARRPRRGNCPARAADTRGASGVAEGRDREMVARH